MKTLTVRQPWADCIIFDEKRIENRTWQTSYRGPLRIHAGLGSDGEYIPVASDGVNHLVGKRGAIIGECILVDCVTPEEALRLFPGQAEWIQGPWCFILNDCKHYPSAIPAKGKLSLWES